MPRTMPGLDFPIFVGRYFSQLDQQLLHIIGLFQFDFPVLLADIFFSIKSGIVTYNQIFSIDQTLSHVITPQTPRQDSCQTGRIKMGCVCTQNHPSWFWTDLLAGTMCNLTLSSKAPAGKLSKLNWQNIGLLFLGGLTLPLICSDNDQVH